MTDRLASLATAATLLLAAAGALGARAGVVPPIVGLLLFALAAGPGSILSVTLGSIALRRARSGDDARRRGRAWASVATGSAFLLFLAALLPGVLAAPPIHDISTDTADPPEFVAARAHPDNRGRDLDYPEGPPDTAVQQADAYPDLGPLAVPMAPDAAYSIALGAADSLGWSITREDRPAGAFEAVEATSVFRFRDDIVVRVRPDDAGGAVIDVRSTSRLGVGDLGANARRIRRFAAAVEAATAAPR